VVKGSAPISSDSNKVRFKFNPIKVVINLRSVCVCASFGQVITFLLVIFLGGN